jgi:hypothetical protein
MSRDKKFSRRLFLLNQALQKSGCEQEKASFLLNNLRREYENYKRNSEMVKFLKKDVNISKKRFKKAESEILEVLKIPQYLHDLQSNELELNEKKYILKYLFSNLNFLESSSKISYYPEITQKEDEEYFSDISENGIFGFTLTKIFELEKEDAKSIIKEVVSENYENAILPIIKRKDDLFIYILDFVRRIGGDELLKYFFNKGKNANDYSVLLNDLVKYNQTQKMELALSEIVAESYVLSQEIWPLFENIVQNELFTHPDDWRYFLCNIEDRFNDSQQEFDGDSMSTFENIENDAIFDAICDDIDGVLESGNDRDVDLLLKAFENNFNNTSSDKLKYFFKEKFFDFIEYNPPNDFFNLVIKKIYEQGDDFFKEIISELLINDDVNYEYIIPSLGIMNFAKILFYSDLIGGDNNDFIKNLLSYKEFFCVKSTLDPLDIDSIEQVQLSQIVLGYVKKLNLFDECRSLYQEYYENMSKMKGLEPEESQFVDFIKKELGLMDIYEDPSQNVSHGSAKPFNSQNYHGKRAHE